MEFYGNLFRENTDKLLDVGKQLVAALSGSKASSSKRNREDDHDDKSDDKS